MLWLFLLLTSDHFKKLLKYLWLNELLAGDSVGNQITTKTLMTQVLRDCNRLRHFNTNCQLSIKTFRSSIDGSIRKFSTCFHTFFKETKSNTTILLNGKFDYLITSQYFSRVFFFVFLVDTKKTAQNS